MPQEFALSAAEKPFKWGDFAHFVETTTFDGDIVEMRQPAMGTEFGRVELSEAAGKGAIEYFCSDYLRVLVFDCSFRDEHTFYVVDDGLVRLNFSLSISIDMMFGGRHSVNVLSPSWRFVSTPPEELTVEQVSPGARLKWVTVCCRPEYLGRLANTVPEDLPLWDTAATQEPDGFAYKPFKFTSALKAATTDLIGLRPDGGLRASYVATKAQELLVLGLDNMLNDQRIGTLSQQVRLSERDIAVLGAARRILDENFTDPPTVAKLGLYVGLNRNKLFYGFKNLFGVSISEYLQDLRIEKGFELLTTTDAPISEIAAQIGFHHQCNFSTAFRARYGMTPSRARACRSGPNPAAKLTAD